MHGYEIGGQIQGVMIMQSMTAGPHSSWLFWRNIRISSARRV
jgi:hypothetical protein